MKLLGNRILRGRTCTTRNCVVKLVDLETYDGVAEGA